MFSIYVKKLCGRRKENSAIQNYINDTHIKTDNQAKTDKKNLIILIVKDELIRFHYDDHPLLIIIIIIRISCAFFQTFLFWLYLPN